MFPLNDPAELAEFASLKGVNLAVPGSEDMLVAGIADLFKAKGIPVLGPDKAAAPSGRQQMLCQGTFMEKYGIKSASYKNFTSFEKAGCLA